MKHIKKLKEFFKINENSNISLFNNEHKLKEILINDQDFAKGEVHQALVNVGYDAWNDVTHDNWTYDDMLNYISKYGDMIIFATMFGIYNGQVCNGGHAQYFDNGNASSESHGMWGSYKDIAKHEDMVELFNDLDLKDKLSVYGKEIYNVINNFELEFDDEMDTCQECDGSGEIELGEDEGYETCPECDGKGEVVVEENVPMTYEWEKLDNKWYKFNDSALEEFNNYLKTLTLDGEKISDIIPIANNYQKYNI